MKTLYLDIFSGISGDMFMGAMLDLGVGLERSPRNCESFRCSGYHLHASRVKRREIEGVKFDVHVGHDHEHGHEQGHEHDSTRTGMNTNQHGRTYARNCALDRRKRPFGVGQDQIHRRVSPPGGGGRENPRPACRGGCIFTKWARWIRLWILWARAWRWNFSGKPRVLAGAVVDGTGWIDCAHGRFPIPAPATLEVLAARGVPISQCDEPHELITPTGAALLAELVEKFGPMEALVPARVGFGVGERDNRTRPNVLARHPGRNAPPPPRTTGRSTPWPFWKPIWTTPAPRFWDISADKAMAAGALDVCYTPAQMKKNRPGVRLSVLCAPAEADRFSELILRHTTAFGLRRWLTERRKLRREFQTVRTPFGDVTLKIGRLDGNMVQIAPEFESCRKLAERATCR